MANNSNTHRNESTTLSLVTDQAPHMTNADLAQAVLRLTHAVNNLLQTGGIVRSEAQETRRAVVARDVTPALPSPRERVLLALASCNSGKPGHMTTVELQKALSLTKSEVWHAYSGKRGLQAAGDVVVVRGRNGGPDVLYHVDAIAL